MNLEDMEYIAHWDMGGTKYDVYRDEGGEMWLVKHKEQPKPPNSLVGCLGCLIFLILLFLLCGGAGNVIFSVLGGKPNLL